MFRLIVFDLDGTLVDSRRDIAESGWRPECDAVSPLDVSQHRIPR